jgi:hypothetical protein
MGIVHVLEEIQIQHHEGDGAFPAANQGDLGGGSLFEAAPVPGAGETVSARSPFQDFHSMLQSLIGALRGIQQPLLGLDSKTVGIGVFLVRLLQSPGQKEAQQDAQETQHHPSQGQGQPGDLDRIDINHRKPCHRV